MLTYNTRAGGALVLITALLIFAGIYIILKNPNLRIHSGIYNEDNGVLPPVESFDELTKTKTVEETAAHGETLPETAETEQTEQTEQKESDETEETREN